MDDDELLRRARRHAGRIVGQPYFVT
jgi:hypothetical protein